MRDIRCRGKSIYTDRWVTGYYIGTGTLCKYGDEHYSVDDDTVGQFTGLFDKNGNRIYEGDILRHFDGSEHPDIGRVFWDAKYCGWRRTTGAEAVDTYRLSGNCVYEVIGNIHDNPELIPC